MSLLDLSAIYASYEEATGAPPYDPRHDVQAPPLRLLGRGDELPGDRAALSRRRRLPLALGQRGPGLPLDRPLSPPPSRGPRRPLHPGARLCARSGPRQARRVALDGTKLRASASRHKAMSYDRMGPKIDELDAEVEAMLAEAEATDHAEDEAFGEDRRGDELPDGARPTGEAPGASIRAAKEAIEAEAKEKAAGRGGRAGEAAGKRPDDEVAAAAPRSPPRRPRPKPEGPAQLHRPRRRG